MVGGSWVAGGACMAGRGVCGRRDGHYSGQYVSNWNAFLFVLLLQEYTWKVTGPGFKCHGLFTQKASSRCRDDYSGEKFDRKLLSFFLTVKDANRNELCYHCCW